MKFLMGGGLKPDTKVRIYTMRTLGRPKLIEVPLGELRWTRKRLGCVNMEWKRMEDGRGGKGGREVVTDFYVEQWGGKSKSGLTEGFLEIVGRVRAQTEDPGFWAKQAAQGAAEGQAEGVAAAVSKQPHKTTPRKKHGKR